MKLIKFIKSILKNIIISALTIYALDVFLIKLNLIIPINICSLSISSILGLPGLITYVILVYKFSG